MSSCRQDVIMVLSIRAKMEAALSGSVDLWVMAHPPVVVFFTIAWMRKNCNDRPAGVVKSLDL